MCLAKIKAKKPGFFSLSEVLYRRPLCETEFLRGKNEAELASKKLRPDISKNSKKPVF